MESFSALQNSVSVYESQNPSASSGFIKPANLKFEQGIIGNGGFGVVRKAVFEGGVVAVKSLQLETSTMDALKSIQMFAAEAEKMRNVRHPCIVEFKGFVLEMFAIVMQFMPDGTLYDYIKQSKNEMPWVERFWCAVDVADGMAFLHSSGLFHQDLKSLNVLLKREDRLKAKISDFGLSIMKRSNKNCSTKMVSDNGNFEVPGSGEVSFVRHVGGTQEYQAPELDESINFTKSCDVFAYGIILYELVTLSKPCRDEHLIKSALETLKPPVVFSQLVLSCTSQSPEERPLFQQIFQSLVDNFSQFDKSAVFLSVSVPHLQKTTNAENSKKSDSKTHQSLSSSKPTTKTTDGSSVYKSFWSYDSKRGTKTGNEDQRKKRLQLAAGIFSLLGAIGLIIGLSVYFSNRSSSALLSDNLSVAQSTSNNVAGTSTAALSNTSTSIGPTTTTTTTTTTATTTQSPIPTLLVGANATTNTFLDSCNATSTRVDCSAAKNVPSPSFHLSSTLAVTNCIFVNCPGIAAASPIVLTNVTFINSTISSNLTKNNNGAIYGGGALCTSSIAIFTDCSFINCSVGVSNYVGGSIYGNLFSKLTLNRVVIDGSSTLNGGGGAIYLDKSASLILNNSAIKNVHTGSSGAIYANGNNQVLIMNSLIQSCVSDLSSAVLYASSPASISVNNSILDSNFGYSGWGGVVYVGGGGSLQITGVTLSNNVGLNSNGGAVYVDIGSTLAVQDSVFVNNTVGLNGQYGGAVYMFVNDGEPYPSFSNVTFTNNTAQEGGGLVLESDFDVTNISISNVNFNSNSAAVNGGGLLLLADLNNQVFNVFGQLPISFTGNTCMGCAADIALSTDNANNASLAFSGPASVSFDCPVGDDMITVLTDPNAVFLDSANGATVSTSSSAMIVCK